jgi:hypothetical protein
MLAERLDCTRCETTMVVRVISPFRWYTCRCRRRIAVDDLDGIVLGLAYEQRRRVSDREFLTLDDEPAMIVRVVARVRIGPDWTRPTIEWTPIASVLTPDSALTSSRPIHRCEG